MAVVEGFLCGVMIELMLLVIIYIIYLCINKKSHVNIFFYINPLKALEFWELVDNKNNVYDCVSVYKLTLFVKNNITSNSPLFNELVEKFSLNYTENYGTNPKVFFTIPKKYAKEHHIKYSKKDLTRWNKIIL